MTDHLDWHSVLVAIVIAVGAVVITWYAGRDKDD